MVGFSPGYTAAQVGWSIIKISTRADLLREVKEGLREGGPENLHVPIQLDIQVQGHWKSLEQMVKSQNIQFSGVIMRMSCSNA